MNPRVRQRGSAYLYVIVCLVVMGGLLMELIPYVTQTRNTQARRARKLRADLATESLVQQVTAEASAQPIVVNTTRSLSLNNASSTATITDGSTVVPNSFCLTGTTVADGQSYRIARYVTQGVGTSPFSFAVYSPSNMNWSGKLIAGASGADGDVYCNGNIDLRSVSGTTINGNISAKASIQLSGATVTGNTIPNSNGVAMPSVSALNYQLNASNQFSGNQTFSSGAAFGGAVNGHYEIDYFSGNVSYQGTISNQGIVFVNGNATITGNVTYGNSTSRMALIVTGNLTINSGVSQVVGLLYVGGSLIVNSADVNNTRGCFVANTITSGPIIRATRDNFTQTSATEGTKLCLPGFWP